MGEIRIAVLGGDARELYIAEQLAADGFRVACFGAGANAGDLGDVEHASSAEEAVHDASWIVCPVPGLGDGDRLYAPGSPVPIVLDRALLEASSASDGGLVLGRATPTAAEAASASGVRVYEMKDDRALAISNATAVAEAVVALLVDKTERVLPEQRLLVIGYGATGAALTDALVGLACRPTVAARRLEHQERARQRGALPVAYADRSAAMEEADIVVNTVPSRDAVPAGTFSALRGAIVVDIASPPGGLDHDAAGPAGVDVTWARGLAGGRAPRSAGDGQLRSIRNAINGDA